jgi:N-acyl-D-amino-acid deacylase
MGSTSKHRFDLLLRGGWVVDGSGGPPFRADLAVAGDRIAAIGRLAGADAAGRTGTGTGPGTGTGTAAEELDVTGRYLMPGFIDAHTHADGLADSTDAQLAALRQGVTTVLIGQDGLSFAPASKATIDAVSRYFGAVNGSCPEELAGGCSIADVLAHYDGNTALNVACLAPAGTIRAEVLGFSGAPAATRQLTAMRTLVEHALEDGAVGLSSGLEYQPGRFADAAELAALCAPVAAAGAVYVSHMRGYEADAWRGMRELTEIVRRAGVAGHVSHYHGPAGLLTALLDDARGQGLDVTFDSYPYLRGSTILGMLALPGDVQAGGPDATLRRLAQPATRQRLARDWFPGIGGVLDRITLAYIGAAEWSWAEGVALTEAAATAGMQPGELVCELLTASQLAAGCVFAQPPTNTEADLRALLRHEAQLAGSDGILLGRWPHPRGWGAFARLLGRHTRELGDWTWGQAAVHLAGHAARRFGLAGRGLLRPGSYADVAVVNPATVADQADYANPRRPARGIHHVLVNGHFALRDGQLTGETPGHAIRRT